MSKTTICSCQDSDIMENCLPGANFIPIQTEKGMQP